MRTTAAARRYARALFGMAREEHRIREIGEEIDSIGALLETSRELRDALLTPLYPARERKAVLAAIADRAELSTTVRNFTSYLIDQRRMVAFASILEEYGRLTNEASGLTTADVVSANPLDDRRKDRLRRALSEQTGREVKLDVRVDPALLGGAIAKVGDLVFDGSLRTQLSQLRSNLTKES